MEIELDLSRLDAFINLPGDQMLLAMLLNIGWIPVALVFLWGIKEIWIEYIRGQWGSQFERILLAIDVPRGNQQTPKAMENVLTYLAGAHNTYNLLEIYWDGCFQLSFSLEIVSIEGYTQFIINTPERFRNLIESAIYSQYPDAEITEVNDYTEGMPTKFPDDEYDIWGAEFIHAFHWCYPIKTYKDFVLQLGEKPEEQFKDPMASLMDLCSSLGKGEQLWFQIITTPAGWDWDQEGEAEISRILKEKTKGKGGIADATINFLISIVDGSFFTGAAEEKKEEKEDDHLRMMNLKPREKKQVEAIQEKISKLSLECKIRFVYIAKKEVINKPKGAYGFVGYMKQFVNMDLNNLKPDMVKTATTGNYLFRQQKINYKKKRLMINYMNRDDVAGRKAGMLNIEELATLWHFPLESVVKAPLIQKTTSKKSKPPMSLLLGEEDTGPAAARDEGSDEVDNIFLEPLNGREYKADKKITDETKIGIGAPEDVGAEPARKAAPPSNLPFEF